MEHHLKVQCIGFIMDGNRRWAKAQTHPQVEGHRKGLETFKTIARHARERNITHIVFYMFSTENWNREAAEVGYLMDLFREAIQNEMWELSKENMRIRFIGQRERFSAELQRSMSNIEKDSENNTGTTLWCALSYGGRAEIIAATKDLVQNREEITEASLSKHLWSAGMPDPDLIIRTGGDKRLSNFLPWQSVYSELFFVDTLWPDFSEDQFDSILGEFSKRERRHGK